MKFTLGKRVEGGGNVRVDLDRLIGTRLLLQANSGAGKSWAIRRLLEQTHTHTFQLVIDVEDEFHTLREKYDYILAGRDGGDCPADPKSAPLLARRLLELGTSTILGIHELKARERVQFVRRFLEALVGAPRKLWRPALVVVDEAHVFCPQVGQAESGGAVIDLMTRGRKRGLAGVLATQRISKLHKDAAAEGNNKLIGRCGLDVDTKRAAEELGLGSKAEQRGLRALEAGQFFAFGPAISEEVVKVAVGGVKTTHPTIGQRSAPPAPAPARVRKVLEQLADIPREAAEEELDASHLRRRVAELERDLGEARRAAEDAARAHDLSAEQWAAIHRATDALKGAVSDAVDSAAANIQAILTQSASPSPRKAPPRQRRVIADQRPARTASAAPSPTAAAGAMGKGPHALLVALASLHPAPASKAQIATLAGYRPRSSTVRNYLSTLKGAGYTAGAGDRIEITDLGIEAAGPVSPPRTTGELLEMWCGRLGSGPAKILRLAVDAYPESITKEDIEEATGYSAASSTMRNYISELRRCSLIDRERGAGVRASASLFPNGRR